MKKTRLLLVVAMLGMALAVVSGASAFGLVYSGTLVGTPTFNRANADCSSLSNHATAVHYDTFTFVAPQTSDYDFFYSSTAIFDPFMLVYEGSFDPNNPLTNCYAGNDDYDTLVPAIFGLPLTAGQTYVVVTTTWSNAISPADYTLVVSDHPLRVPNRGEVLISAGAPVVPYAAPGEYALGITLPADYDGNGFDTYVVTGSTTLNGETWYSIFLGNEDFVWVRASQVQVLR